MRRDSNFLLTTILWGNVGVNVLLTLLSDSVLAGLAAFLFSTVVITVFGATPDVDDVTVPAPSSLLIAFSIDVASSAGVAGMASGSKACTVTGGPPSTETVMLLPLLCRSPGRVSPVPDVDEPAPRAAIGPASAARLAEISWDPALTTAST